jgi:hypothetical protein
MTAVHTIYRVGLRCCNRFVIGQLSPYNLPRFDQPAATASGEANDFRLQPINRPPGRKNYGAL